MSSRSGVNSCATPASMINQRSASGRSFSSNHRHLFSVDVGGPPPLDHDHVLDAVGMIVGPRGYVASEDEDPPRTDPLGKPARNRPHRDRRPHERVGRPPQLRLQSLHSGREGLAPQNEVDRIAQLPKPTLVHRPFLPHSWWGRSPPAAEGPQLLFRRLEARGRCGICGSASCAAQQPTHPSSPTHPCAALSERGRRSHIPPPWHNHRRVRAAGFEQPGTDYDFATSTPCCFNTFTCTCCASSASPTLSE